jgi:hypothetical protein
MQFFTLQCLFSLIHLQELCLVFELGVLGLLFWEYFFLVSSLNSVCSNSMCQHSEASSSHLCLLSYDLCQTPLLFNKIFCILTGSSNQDIFTC